MIKIVGLGPGSTEALTVGTLEVLKNSSNIYLRTERHPTVDYIRTLGIKFSTYDSAYESFESFDEVYKAIAEDLMKRHGEKGDIVYAVPGHPLVAEKSVSLLMEYCEAQKMEYEILPAVSFIDAIMERLKIDPIEGFKIVDAFDAKSHIFDKRIGTVITQVYDNYIASEVKLAVSEYYSDDTEVFFVRAAGIKGLESIRKIPLYEIDRQEDIDYLTSIYIPSYPDDSKDFYDLLSIMEKLRGESGCPWDREQTHESLKRYLIEESYEVLEAIDEQDDMKIVEELGDVLLQVVFHAQLGKEDGYFNINDIIEGICKKMIDRHPHVFSNVEVKNSSEVLANWEDIKREEKGMQTTTEELNHIAKNLPALLRAEKIQSKARKVGFDWDRVECALDKVLEELNELKEVYNGENRARILEEIGDLLFAVVNVSRFLEINPEEALSNTNNKFIKRFEFMEKTAEEMGIKLQNMTLEEMDQLWEKAKKIKKV